MTPLGRVRLLLAAVVRVQEALADGDAALASAILESLELDARELAMSLEYREAA